MFAFLEAVLAVIGVLALVALYDMWDEGIFDDAPPTTPDPYRLGLDASARMSALAWEAEQTMHRVAEQSQREEAE